MFMNGSRAWRTSGSAAGRLFISCSSNVGLKNHRLAWRREVRTRIFVITGLPITTQEDAGVYGDVRVISKIVADVECRVGGVDGRNDRVLLAARSEQKRVGSHTVVRRRGFDHLETSPLEELNVEGVERRVLHIHLLDRVFRFWRWQRRSVPARQTPTDGTH